MTAIKVLHYLRHLGLGGTEKTCQLFFEHSSEDFEVHVAYERSGDHPRLEEFVKAAKVCGGTLHVVDSYKGDRPDPTSLQHVIDNTGVDLLHVYRSGYQEFPIGEVKVSHSIETNVFGFVDSSYQVDKTLFMSKWLMNYALRGRTGDRFDFVNNPVESPYTHLGLDLDKSAIWLGRCGRPDNGIYNSVSVDAARLLRMQGYDVRFIMAAPPSNMIKDLEEYEIPYHTIEPTTNPLVLSTFYNSIDILAHARADGETFGVNIAEAMMHGKPVVTHIATPSVPGMGVFQSQTELVDDGVTGFIVNNDVAEYAEALKKLIDSPNMRERFGHAGFEKATREYHVDACQEKLEKTYRDVVNEEN